jgi:hypothetical protein
VSDAAMRNATSYLSVGGPRRRAAGRIDSNHMEVCDAGKRRHDP